MERRIIQTLPTTSKQKWIDNAIMFMFVHWNQNSIMESLLLVYTTTTLSKIKRRNAKSVKSCSGGVSPAENDVVRSDCELRCFPSHWNVSQHQFKSSGTCINTNCLLFFVFILIIIAMNSCTVNFKLMHNYFCVRSNSWCFWRCFLPHLLHFLKTFITPFLVFSLFAFAYNVIDIGVSVYIHV